MLLRVFSIDFFVGYTMMSIELKIECCFSTDDRDEAVLLLRLTCLNQINGTGKLDFKSIFQYVFKPFMII